jgi:hypothetical protein
MLINQPSFIETSAGYINLSLVKVIEVDENSVRFWFGGEKENVEAVVVPLQEGETVLARIRNNCLIF